jgi:hypothetical protein
LAFGILKCFTFFIIHTQEASFIAIARDVSATAKQLQRIQVLKLTTITSTHDKSLQVNRFTHRHISPVLS